MLADAIEGIAEDQRLADVSVEERLDSQVVARAKEALPRPVPDGEGEVAQQMLDAILAPGLVGAQDQLDIGGVRERDFRDPGLGVGASSSRRASTRASATIQTWPSRVKGCRSCSDSSVVLSRVWPNPTLPSTPYFLRIGTAKGHEAGHLPQQMAVHRRSIEMYDANDAAHGGFPA